MSEHDDDAPNGTNELPRVTTAYGDLPHIGNINLDETPDAANWLRPHWREHDDGLARPIQGGQSQGDNDSELDIGHNAGEDEGASEQG